jgi:hypothetical protein
MFFAFGKSFINHKARKGAAHKEHEEKNTETKFLRKISA